MAKRKIPINRGNRWFDQSDFDVDIEMGRDYIEGDGNYRVVLFAIDSIKTNDDDLYNESRVKSVKYFPPVELVGVVDIDAPENSTYTDGRFNFQTMGNLTFGCYEQELKNKKVDVKYGDVLGYAIDEETMVYFEVFDDGRINIDNPKTYMGYKKYFRTIVAKHIDENKFKG